MTEKSRWLLPFALTGALIGGYQLSKTDVGQEVLRYLQNKPAIVQTASERHVSTKSYVPLKGVEVENDFQYSANDFWFSRNDSLEELAKTTNRDSITPEIMSDLRVIAKGDQNPLIRGLASSMIKSYEANKDFSETEPYKEKLAEKLRLTIQTSTDFGYDSKNFWYNRLGSLRSLLRNSSEISDGLMKDLELIADRENDFRIRRLASSMIKSYEENKDFSAVEGYPSKK